MDNSASAYLSASLLSQQAIDLALSGRWKEAIKVNLQILKNSSPSASLEIDTLNRLGRAYMETGQKTKSLQIYQKVLRLDKFNTIAAKNLNLLKTSRVNHQTTFSSTPTPPLFLEEPGVTKTIQPVRPGDPKILSRLHPGNPVIVSVRQHNVVFLSTNSEYLGRFPDDLAARLRTLIKAGNTYQAWVRSVNPFRVFVKETYRSPKHAHTPSFPLTEKLTYAAFTPPELIHEEKPDVSATEEQEDRPTPESTSLENFEGERDESTSLSDR